MSKPTQHPKKCNFILYLDTFMRKKNSVQSPKVTVFWQFLFTKPTHHWLGQLALSNCVTQKLYNNPYSMTPHYWYKSSLGWRQWTSTGISWSNGALCRSNKLFKRLEPLFPPQREGDSGILWPAPRLLLLTLNCWCIENKLLNHWLESALLWCVVQTYQREDM